MDVTIINIPDCHKTIRQVDEIVDISNMFQYFCAILDYRQTFTTALFEYYSTVKGAENGINFIKNRSDKKKILLLQLNTVVGNSVSLYNEYIEANYLTHKFKKKLKKNCYKNKCMVNIYIICYLSNSRQPV